MSKDNRSEAKVLDQLVESLGNYSSFTDKSDNPFDGFVKGAYDVIACSYAALDKPRKANQIIQDMEQMWNVSEEDLEFAADTIFRVHGKFVAKLGTDQSRLLDLLGTEDTEDFACGYIEFIGSIERISMLQGRGFTKKTRPTIEEIARRFDDDSLVHHVIEDLDRQLEGAVATGSASGQSTAILRNPLKNQIKRYPALIPARIAVAILTGPYFKSDLSSKVSTAKIRRYQNFKKDKTYIGLELYKFIGSDIRISLSTVQSHFKTHISAMIKNGCVIPISCTPEDFDQSNNYVAVYVNSRRRDIVDLIRKYCEESGRYKIRGLFTPQPQISGE